MSERKSDSEAAEAVVPVPVESVATAEAEALPLQGRISSPRPEIASCALEGDLRRAAESKAAETGVTLSAWLRGLVIAGVGDSRPFRYRRCAESGLAWLRDFEGIVRDNPGVLSDDFRLSFSSVRRAAARLMSRVLADGAFSSPKICCPFCDIRMSDPDAEKRLRDIESHLCGHFGAYANEAWEEPAPSSRDVETKRTTDSARPFSFAGKREKQVASKTTRNTLPELPEGESREAKGPRVEFRVGQKREEQIAGRG